MFYFYYIKLINQHSEVNLDETRSAIEFGQRAMTIKQHAKLHVEIDYKALCKKLQDQLDSRGDVANQDLIDEIKSDYEAQIQNRDVRIRVLEMEVEELRGGASPRDGSPPPKSSGSGSGSGGDRRSKKEGKESKESRSRRSDKERDSSDRDREESDSGSRHRDPGESSSRSDRDKDRSSKSKYKAIVKELEEKLDSSGMQIAKLRKEKVGLSRSSNDLEAKLQQKTIQINLLAARYQTMLREKEDKVETMQAAILKLQKGDYISPTADLEVDDSDASPRPQGMADNDYIQRLELVVRKLREKQSQLTAYHQKSKDAIQYLQYQWEEEQEKWQTERERRKKTEAKLDRYRSK